MISVRRDTDDGIATVTLDRPPVNALTVDLCREIGETFRRLGGAPGTRCVVFTAAGSRAFCAGLDFRDFFSTTDDEATRAVVVRDMYSAVYQCSVPVVAAVGGPALGAGSVLASVCDIRVASRAATFGLPEVNLGRVGGAAHHGRLIPQGLLRRMVFTGEHISASEAFRVGFVDELVPADAFSAAYDLARRIAAKSVVGLRHAKESLNEVEHLGPDEGYAREQARNGLLRRTPDAQEASRAVMEKRAPLFKER